ncbi:Bacterial Ig-like domain (group 1) [Rubripirellula obstinata]|uniref:Bacterial Ig-like domain (Group 1) n=2 Tax=Rubripirellula obstinata TaxID=406547 RepID=A0A5B1CEZ9_9BACT|nr:Bacterial Ig-like domain (group 1) [Rubripirellula obstinata]
MHGTFSFCKTAIAFVWFATLLVAASIADGEDVAVEQIKPITITGRVVDLESAGVSGAEVSVQYRQISGMAEATATTDASGDFSVSVKSKPIAFRQWEIVATTDDGREVGFFRYDQSEETNANSEIEIQVEPGQPRAVEVLDAEGNPVVGARVVLQLAYPHSVDGQFTDENGRLELIVPESERVQSVIAWKDDVGFDYQVYALDRNQQADLKTPVPEFPVAGETLRLDGAVPVTVKVVDSSGLPIKGVRLYPWILRKETANRELNLSYFTDSVSQVTDTSGQTTFAWMPTWQTSIVTIWPNVEGYTRTRANYEPAVDQGEFTVTLNQLVTIQGTVFDDQGKPAGGISVGARGDGYGWDNGRGQTTSNDDGTYKLQVTPEQVYMVTAADDERVTDAVPSFAVNVDEPVVGIDLRLRKPTRLTGRLTEEPSGDPIQNERVIVYQYGDDLNSIEGATIANPENSSRYIRPMLVRNARTDDEGRFEFRLGDGAYDIRPPRQEKTEKFEVSGEESLTIDVTTEIQKKVKLTGVVREHKEDRPLAGVRLSGVSQRFNGDDWEALSDEDGSFAVERLGEPAYVHAVSADKSLGAVAILPADENTLEMHLKPTGSAYGILHETDSETPAALIKIQFGIRIPDENNQTWSNRFGGSVVTDSEGRFELVGLVPGWEYELHLEPGPDGTIPSLDSVNIDPGQRVDMGTMTIPAPRKPYVPPTLDERIAKAMGVDATAMDRFTRAIPRCKLNKQKMLMVIGKPDDSRLRRFMQLRYEDRDFRKVRDEFLIMALSTNTPDNVASVEQLFDELNVETTDASTDFSIVLIDSEGALISDNAVTNLLEDDELSKDVVIEWLRSHIGQPIDAKKLLDEALARAKQENKRVLVQETATWCGPCHLLSNFLNENRQWETDYLWIKMDHRFTGARKIMAELRGDASGGVPWYAILDSDGEKLATSNHFETGNNIGFPSRKDGQEHFKRMLLDTRLSMTEDQVDAFVAQLKKKK